ncbi:MAG: hypothetical protein EZS28_050367 [Streblomastix strix]|uniref:Tyr recombinase domain-containing protein n=1 Tax=Streblomastix strix TaxID=222440 RepID=A0A5J4T6P5_9EUKA|nr:MAG: hypothetical protein EZS28_050367 [Streblomastix strix]
MLKPVSNTRKVIREVTIWKKEQLLDYIVKLSEQRDEGILTVTELRRVVITIFMVYSVLRLSEIQRAIENKRSLTPEECSKEVLIIMSNAGINKKHSVTTIRKVAISAMQNRNKTKIEIDRWSRHSEAADTVRENYDVNNNDSIRKALYERVSTREEGGVNESKE